MYTLKQYKVRMCTFVVYTISFIGCFERGYFLLCNYRDFDLLLVVLDTPH